MSISVGSAHLDLTASTAKALASLRSFSPQAVAVLKPLTNVELKVKTTVQKPKVADVRAALAGVTATVKIDIAVKPLTQKALNAALTGVKAEKTIKITVDSADAATRLANIRTILSNLGTTVRGLFNIQTTGLNAVLTAGNAMLARFATVITDLRALITQLNASGGRPNGPPGGGSGSSSGVSSYSAQLKLLQADLKSGAINSTQFETATKALKASIDAEIISLRSLGVLTLDEQKKLDALRISSGQTGAALKGLGTGPAASVAQLSRELDIANSRFQRGDITLRDYLREQQRITTAGAALRSSLVAGSTEAQKLESVFGKLRTATQGINSKSIDQLKLSLSQARASFDQAAAAAGNYTQRRNALVDYQRSVEQLTQRITALGQRTTLTAQQTKQLADLQARLAREQATLQGGNNPLGLGGNVLNALRTAFPLVQQMGGSLGAAAGQASGLAGGMGALGGAAGLLGIAIGAVVLTLGAFVTAVIAGIGQVKQLENAFAVLKANGETNLAGISVGLDRLKQSGNAAAETFTKGELAAALGDIVKAGVSTKDALILVATSTKLAASENQNLTLSSSMLLKNLRQYQLGVKDAARVGDELSKAGLLAAGSVADLSTGLGIVAGTGRAAKVEMYDLLGMLVELDNKGMSAADVGANGLRAALAALADITPKGREALHSLGVATEDTTGHARTAGDIMKDLSSKLRDMGIKADASTGELIGNGDALQKVSGIMDTRAAAAVLNLTGDWKNYAEEIKNSNGSLSSYSKTMLDTLDGNQRKLKASLSDLGGNITNLVATPLTNVLTTLNDIITKLNGGIPGFSKFLQQAGVDGTQLDEATAQKLQRLTQRRDSVQSKLNIFDAADGGLIDLKNAPYLKDQYAALKAELVTLTTEIKRVTGAVKSGKAPSFTVQGTAGAPVAVDQRLGSAVVKATEKPFNNKEADAIVDYCDRYVRLAFNRAFPTISNQLNALFLSNPGKDGYATAQTSYQNFSKAGLVRKYTGLGDLHEGDAVFYTDGGQNHVGIYLKDGYVRGNNRVTARATGGKQVVGDVYITALGNPTGVVSASELATRYGVKVAAAVAKATTPKPAPTGTGTSGTGGPKPGTDAYLKATLDKGKALLANYNAALLSGNEVWQAKALKSVKAFAANNQAAYATLIKNNPITEVSKYGAVYDRLRRSLNISVSLKDLGTSAATTVKALTTVRDAAKKAADVELKANGQSEKYSQLVDLARDAQKQIEGFSKSTVQAEINDAATVSTLRKNLAASDRTAAEGSLASLRASLDAQLAAQKGNATARLNLARNLGGEIKKGEDALALQVLKATQKQNLADATTERLKQKKANGGKVPAAAETLISQNLIQLNKAAEATYQAALSTNASAQAERISNAQNAVYAKQNALRKEATANAEEAARQGRELAAQQVANAEETARLIGQTLTRSRDTQLKLAEGNAAGQLAIQKAYAPQIKKAADDEALAVLQTRKAANEALKAQRIKEANDKITNAGELNARLTAIDKAFQTENTLAYKAYTENLAVSRDAAKVAVDEAKKQAEQQSKTAKTLSQDIKQLNDRFQTQVTQGRVTADSLQTYGQALQDAKDKVDLLPPALRGNAQALLAQGAQLAKTGQGVANYNSELGKLKEAVKNYTFAELEAARARVEANGGDKKKLDLIDAQIRKYKQLTTAQVDQADLDSQVAQTGSTASGLEGQRDNAVAAAKGNLAEIYRLEVQYGEQIQEARDEAARVASDRDILAVQEKYDKLLSLAGISAEQRVQLEADEAGEIEAIGVALTNTLGKNASDRATTEVNAKTALDERLRTMNRESQATIRKDLLDGFKRDTAETEAHQQEELDAEDLTEGQKLAIRQRYQKLLLDQKAKEVQASRAIEVQAENDRYDDAVEAARKDGTLATQEATLLKVHNAELGRINQEFDDSERDYRLGVKRETGKQLLAAQKETSASLLEEARGHTDDILGGVDTAEAAQRQSARNTLEFWRTTYAGMGLAGKAALDEVNAALKKLDQAGDKAREDASKLIVDDQGPVRAQAATDLGAIGKPEDAQDAYDKAVSAFSSKKEEYQKALTDLAKGLAQFKEKRDEDLTPDQQRMRDGLLGTQQLYQELYDNVVLAAGQAGDKASEAFTKAKNDADADAALNLVEAQKALADVEGKDGSPAYIAGLNAALAYWRARLLGMDENAKGTAEYLAALQKITDLETKVQATKSTGGLASAFKDASGIVGKANALSAGVSSALDGLGAYFEAGGSSGGKKSILLGAAALVSGLAAVFTTGDEDMDRVTNTFVNGVTSVLSKLATGDTVGAIISGVATVVSTIVDIFTGGANSAKKAAADIASATKDVKLFDVSKYAKTVSAGGFFGFLGFKKSEIDTESIGIAKTLGDALYDAISGGMLDGIKAGKASFGELGIDIKKSLSTQILQGLIDGFLKSAVFQATIQPFLDKYIAAMKSGNSEALAAAASDLSGAIDKGNGQLKQFYTNVLVPTSKKLGVYGSDTASSTSSAASDLGLIGTLPDPVVQSVDTQALTATVSTLSQTVTRLQSAVDVLTDRGIPLDIALSRQADSVRYQSTTGSLRNL